MDQNLVNLLVALIPSIAGIIGVVSSVIACIRKIRSISDKTDEKVKELQNNLAVTIKQNADLQKVNADYQAKLAELETLKNEEIAKLEVDIKEIVELVKAKASSDALIQSLINQIKALREQLKNEGK